MNPKHLLPFVLLPLILLVIAASYYRFIVKGDYVVEYQIDCDPAAASCFVGLDDATQENYYYAKMHKYGPDLAAQCGKDIADCDAANACQPGDRDCAVTYCSDATVSGDESCYAQPDQEPVTDAPSTDTIAPQPL